MDLGLSSFAPMDFAKMSPQGQTERASSPLYLVPGTLGSGHERADAASARCISHGFRAFAILGTAHTPGTFGPIRRSASGEVA